jgi:hypothetical protein
VNPSPQSESTWHGRSYFGTHDFDVIVVHAPASTTAGSAHRASLGQLGATSTGGQLTAESVKQTMPVAQSESVLHGPGSHSLMICGSQIGMSHSSPRAHAMAGQADAPTVWQENPLPQSVSFAHVMLWACAVREAPRAPSETNMATVRRVNRDDII